MVSMLCFVGFVGSISDCGRTLVSNTLNYSPERCTVIAMYGHLVVGAAFLSSPQETYITYLAVRAGWENAQIATYVVLLCCKRQPGRLFRSS